MSLAPKPAVRAKRVPIIISVRPNTRKVSSARARIETRIRYSIHITPAPKIRTSRASQNSRWLRNRCRPCCWTSTVGLTTLTGPSSDPASERSPFACSAAGTTEEGGETCCARVHAPALESSTTKMLMPGMRSIVESRERVVARFRRMPHIRHTRQCCQGTGRGAADPAEPPGPEADRQSEIGRLKPPTATDLGVARPFEIAGTKRLDYVDSLVV